MGPGQGQGLGQGQGQGQGLGQGQGKGQGQGQGLGQGQIQGLGLGGGQGGVQRGGLGQGQAQGQGNMETSAGVGSVPPQSAPDTPMTRMKGAHLENAVNSVIFGCLSASTVLSLRAALSVSLQFGYYDVAEQIRGR
jgi:hypothetical protein